jgi:hypothetical protein
VILLFFVKKIEILGEGKKLIDNLWTLFICFFLIFFKYREAPASCLKAHDKELRGIFPKNENLKRPKLPLPPLFAKARCSRVWR